MVGLCGEGCEVLGWLYVIAIAHEIIVLHTVLGLNAVADHANNMTK